MNLASPRLELRGLSLAELEGNYIAWFNDPDVCKYNSHGEITYTKEMAIAFINALEHDTSKEVYAVYHKDDNRHIGNISLQSISHKNKSAEIAYIFGEKHYWKKGYAHEASQALLTHAFCNLQLHRIFFGTHVENTPMRALGEKLGFSLEGLFRDAQYKMGKFNDIVMYALLRNEYEIL